MAAWPDALHIKERMEQWVDKLGALRQEARKFLLQCSVDIVVLVRCNLKVLFELMAAQETGAMVYAVREMHSKLEDRLP